VCGVETSTMRRPGPELGCCATEKKIKLLQQMSMMVFRHLIFRRGHAVVQLKGRGFNSRLRNPSGCTMALRSTQPLTEMSTRHISWGVKATGA